MLKDSAPVPAEAGTGVGGGGDGPCLVGECEG